MYIGYTAYRHHLYHPHYQSPREDPEHMVEYCQCEIVPLQRPGGSDILLLLCVGTTGWPFQHYLYHEALMLCFCCMLVAIAKAVHQCRAP